MTYGFNMRVGRQIKLLVAVCIGTLAPIMLKQLQLTYDLQSHFLFFYFIVC